jgi:hypothetical protein
MSKPGLAAGKTEGGEVGAPPLKDMPRLWSLVVTGPLARWDRAWKR